MRRVFVACHTCSHRLCLIGKSPKTFGVPAAPMERYYRCPHCQAEWTYNVDQHALSPGAPPYCTQIRSLRS